MGRDHATIHREPHGLFGRNQDLRDKTRMNGGAWRRHTDPFSARTGVYAHGTAACLRGGSWNHGKGFRGHGPYGGRQRIDESCPLWMGGLRAGYA